MEIYVSSIKNLLKNAMIIRLSSYVRFIFAEKNSTEPLKTLRSVGFTSQKDH